MISKNIIFNFVQYLQLLLIPIFYLFICETKDRLMVSIICAYVFIICSINLIVQIYFTYYKSSIKIKDNLLKFGSIVMIEQVFSLLFGFDWFKVNVILNLSLMGCFIITHVVSCYILSPSQYHKIIEKYLYDKFTKNLKE